MASDTTSLAMDGAGNFGPAGDGRRSAWNGLFFTPKDVFDFLLGLVLLVLLSPVLLAVAAAVKLSSAGPVLFVQDRWGQNGSVIRVFKFRTMRVECEDRLAARQTERNDPRVTPVGHVLRRTSLDELPQLLNVVRGEMSLVGPRPHALGMTVEGRPNAEAVPAYFQRYRAKPGITGLAQIKGYRGPADTIEHLAQRVRYDIEYIASSSLLLDLCILAKTGFKMLHDPSAR
ncbi:sugar transferase [Roseicella aerolata]|uniref:Sugar transferase n=1 Tax=Roseicella aerolata TaxID=2883479 RepID=A0A9X1IBT9_9PROT|nr:sugar transferase [Roseicella aerolata]MCB4821356.1 sugar transferase [Roseicella aerolata]